MPGHHKFLIPNYKSPIFRDPVNRIVKFIDFEDGQMADVINGPVMGTLPRIVCIKITGVHRPAYGRYVTAVLGECY